MNFVQSNAGLLESLKSCNQFISMFLFSLNLLKKPRNSFTLNVLLDGKFNLLDYRSISTGIIGIVCDNSAVSIWSIPIVIPCFAAIAKTSLLTTMLRCCVVELVNLVTFGCRRRCNWKIGVSTASSAFGLHFRFGYYETPHVLVRKKHTDLA